MNRSNTKALLNKRQVADLLGVSIWAIDSWVSQRKIPFIKLGRCVRFDLSEIEPWLARQKVSPEYPPF